MNGERDTNLVAPCGMDCALCSNYLAFLHQIPRKRGKISHCAGCRPRNKQCSILKRDCERLRNRTVDYCFRCSEFPCGNLLHIDAHYRKKYSTSLVENLICIRDRGIEALFTYENERFGCTRCGNLKSVHSGRCYVCDTIHSWKD
jgi:hypothetical protein